MSYTRRAILALFAIPVFARAASQNCAVRQLFARRQNIGGTFHERHYRIHASVLFLGASLFTRQEVGGSWFTLEESTKPDGKATTIRFVGGSWPANARGLNRFGVMEETVLERAAAVAESAYLGFMTGSEEADFGQARRALAPAAGDIACTLGHGYSAPGHVRCGLTRFDVPSSTRWTEGMQILERQHALIEGEPPESHRFESRPYPTFFYAVRRAMAGAAEHTNSRFLHNSKLEQLETSQQPDTDGSTKLSGIIRDEQGRKGSTFTVWYRKTDANPLPLRFEFRARSFLRLTFEQDSKKVA